MSSIRSTVGLCLFFITIVLVMFVISVTRTPQLSAEAMRSKGVFILPRPRALAEFELTDHLGNQFDNAALEGHWSFIFFGFTNCPDICPTSMSVLGQVDQQLHASASEMADQFKGVMVSLDPERDQLEPLGTYAQAFSSRFLGVTGERDALVTLTDQVNVAFAKVPLSSVGADDIPQEQRYTIDHTGNIVIINPRGHYHGFIKLPHDAETIRLSFQTLAAQF